jgi:hypothetical protein
MELVKTFSLPASETLFEIKRSVFGASLKRDKRLLAIREFTKREARMKPLEMRSFTGKKF